MNSETSVDATVRGLRAFADFLELHPDLYSSWETIRYVHIVDTAAEFAGAIRATGSGEKGQLDSAEKLTFTRDFGGGVSFEVWVPKAETCVQRVVGQKTVTKLVPPPDVEMVEVTETVDVIEWVCPPSFLALEGSDDRSSLR